MAREMTPAKQKKRGPRTHLASPLCSRGVLFRAGPLGRLGRGHGFLRRFCLCLCLYASERRRMRGCGDGVGGGGCLRQRLSIARPRVFCRIPSHPAIAAAVTLPSALMYRGRKQQQGGPSLVIGGGGGDQLDRRRRGVAARSLRLPTKMVQLTWLSMILLIGLMVFGLMNGVEFGRDRSTDLSSSLGCVKSIHPNLKHQNKS